MITQEQAYTSPIWQRRFADARDACAYIAETKAIAEKSYFVPASRHLTGMVSTGARAPGSVSVSVNKKSTVESVLLERQSVLSIQNQ